MSDSTDHWNFLAKLIGARPSEAPATPKSAPPKPEPPKAASPQPAAPAPQAEKPQAPKTAQSDWNQLASMLGVPEAQRPEPKPQASTPARASTAQPPRKPEAAPSQPVADTPSAKAAIASPSNNTADSKKTSLPETADLKQGDTERGSAERADVGAGGERSKKDFKKKPARKNPRNRPARVTRVTDEAVEFDWSITSALSASAPDQNEKQSPTSPSVFSSDSNELKSGARSGSPAHASHARKPNVEEDLATADATAEDTSETELDAVDSPSAEDENEEGRRKPNRRRRRRRRGGGRKNLAASSSSEEQDTAISADGDQADVESLGDATDSVISAAAEDAADDADASEASAPQKPKRRRRRRRSSGKNKALEASVTSSTEEELPLDDEDELETEDLPEATSSKPSGNGPRGTSANSGSKSRESASSAAARDIPSWDDAIGVIVATNMEARAKSGRNSGNNKSHHRGRNGNGRHEQNGNHPNQNGNQGAPGGRS